MSLSQLDAFIFLAAVVLTTLIYLDRRRRRHFLPFPPGPKKVPILGNLLDLPKESEWKAYAKWGEDYGTDIIHLRIAGSDFIVLNSLDAATELLDKRSYIYSSRPNFEVMNEMMGWKWLMSAMPYGTPWRERRRLFQRHFHPSQAKAYQPTQIESIHKMLVRLFEEPEDFMGITRHSIGGMAMAMAYGLAIRKRDDPYIKVAEEAAQSIIEATKPAALVLKLMPFLKHIPSWIPGTDSLKRIRYCNTLQERFHNVPFQAAVNSVINGTAKPSFATDNLMSIDESGNVAHQKEVIKDTAGIVFAAGADTTLSGIETLFLALMLHPEVQAKAQHELDQVLGRGPRRLPEFSDQSSLPYVTAVVREVLRWRPATPTGVPHLAGADDIYEGYRIPKGAFVIGNAWAMLHDENVYPDPASFNPDRFMRDGKLNPDVPDPALMAFGFGRRACPGSHIGISTTFMVAATVLSTLDISKPRDEKGVPIEQDVKYQSGIICHPEHFKCVIKPRSSEAEALIKSIPDAY